MRSRALSVATRGATLAALCVTGAASAAVVSTAAAQPGARPTLSACALGGLMQRDVAMRRAGVPPSDSVFERRLTDMASADLDRVVTLRHRAAPDGPSPVRIRLGQRPGWIGVQTSEVSNVRESADGRSVLYCDYPVIVSVEPGSPAQRGGLEAGDTVVAYNGRDLRSGSEISLGQLLVPNDTLRVTVRRDSRVLELAVVVASRPESMTAWSGGTPGPGQSYSYVFVTPNGERRVVSSSAPTTEAARAERAQIAVRAARTSEGGSSRPPGAVPGGSRPVTAFSPMLLTFGVGGSALAGAQLVAVDDDLGAVIGTRRGVLILKVADGTPASAAGLRAGDVITVAAGRAVTTPGVLQQALARRFEERALALRVVRKGKPRDVTLRW